MVRANPLRRLPFLLAGMLCLLAGLWGGLLLLGLPLPSLGGTPAADHGILMTLGFLGTVISLERAVALRRGWAFGAPAAAGVGSLVLVLGGPLLVSQLLLCLASVVMLVVYAVVLRIQPELHLQAMAAGAACWYIATVLWIGGWTVTRLVPWLVGFLVLTILGERLELARVGMLVPRSVHRFGGALAVFAAGLVLTTVGTLLAPGHGTGDMTGGAGALWDHGGTLADWGVRLAGLGLVLLAGWGAAYDVARRTVRIAGVTRYMAVCLLAGYLWLIAGGLIWLVAGDLGAHLALYDAALHSVLLGFVMSMIFGHAPVIVPAVLRVRLPFHPFFYVQLGLLHVALLARVLAGDLWGNQTAWRIGGVATEVAVVLFLVVSVTAVLGARGGGGRSPAQSQPAAQAEPGEVRP